jgi:DNA-binding SARP family transcriptional activator
MTPIEILTVRLDSLQKEIIELMAHKIIHTDILSELSDTRETVADLRREFRQKIALLTDGLEMVPCDKFDTWVQTLKSKMNIL